MTSWIQTEPLCRLFDMMYPRLHWSTQWGHHGSHLYDFSQSFVFRDQGPGMVWDADTKTNTEPLADERERAMGFCTGIITAPGLLEGQRRFVLSQAMDLHTMVRTVSLCLALKQHYCDSLLSLGARTLVRGHCGPHSWKKELGS